MMKSLRMARVLSTIKRKNNSGLDVSVSSDDNSPEAIACRNVKSFCESSGHNSSEDEVIYLPAIVENAESSPAAAKQCADMIRDYLKKDYITRPDIQYNALMLTRILAENPGLTFTKNLDQEFTKTAKDLLRNKRHGKVQQILMETLEFFETTKFYDDALTPLIEMWKKEKEKATKSSSGAPIQSYLHRQPTAPPPPQQQQWQQWQQWQQPQPQMSHVMTAPPVDRHSQNYFARKQPTNRLPDPVELTSRLEEARTSANLLQQVVTNTPPAEVLSNDLIKEFAERCQSASRSLQGYMTSDNPTPDNDTMESLLDTNEQLQAALNLHQRAMLNARKTVTSAAADDGDLVSLGETQSIQDRLENSRRPSPAGAGLGISLASGSGSKRETNGKGKGREYEPLPYAGSSAGPSRSRTPAEDDPFRDPDEVAGSSAAGPSKDPYLDMEPRLHFEPFHPGFGSTPSYMGRQESAIGKEAMHGAVEDSSFGKATHVESGRHAENSDNDSLYGASPPNQEPIYRY
ncbi:hypothetical protein F4861DRAFT_96379 [Xylaria intraflava]|nr:hypothetical protein F4861DRAFT_96379 [Xylaria intraflava]